MDKVFIKVDPKVRLPKKNGVVAFINADGDMNTTYYDKEGTLGSSVVYWLEEVTLPDKATLKEIRVNMGCKAALEYLLDRLKGDRHG